MTDGAALAAACSALPVELVELRPGRSVAVHRRAGKASKPRIFFVHGSCASMLQYQAMIEHFAAAGHEVVAYDFLGCGRSPKPDDWYAYSSDELRDDLAAVVARFGVGEVQNVLVCHSAGCSLALCIGASPRHQPVALSTSTDHFRRCIYATQPRPRRRRASTPCACSARGDQAHLPSSGCRSSCSTGCSRRSHAASRRSRCTRTRSRAPRRYPRWVDRIAHRRIRAQSAR